MCPQNPAEPVTPQSWIRQGMRSWLCPKSPPCQESKDSAAPLQANPAQAELLWGSYLKLGLLLALTDAQCHFSGGNGFGHSTSKPGWGCQEVLGEPSPCAWPPQDTPPMQGISPGTKSEGFCFVLSTVLAHFALPGITSIPWSPAQLWGAALKTWLRLWAVT